MTALLKVFLYLAAGELIVAYTMAPVPGSIIGLSLMLVDFFLNKAPDPDVERIFDAVSKHLTLLFIPAGAGVLAYPTLLEDGWWIIAVAVTLGTITTMLVTALAFKLTLACQFKTPSWVSGLKAALSRRSVL